VYRIALYFVTNLKTNPQELKNHTSYIWWNFATFSNLTVWNFATLPLEFITSLSFYYLNGLQSKSVVACCFIDDEDKSEDSQRLAKDSLG